MNSSWTLDQRNQTTVTKAHQGLFSLQTRCVPLRPLCGASFLHRHFIAFRFEFGSRFPLGKFFAVRDLIADLEKKLNVFRAAGNVPLWINLIARLMIMF